MNTQRLLVIDTETSGLFDWSRPADAEGQPRMSSLAMLAVLGERVWLKAHAYVRPDGWTMAPDATAICHTQTLKHTRDSGS